MFQCIQIRKFKLETDSKWVISLKKYNYKPAYFDDYVWVDLCIINVYSNMEYIFLQFVRIEYCTIRRVVDTKVDNYKPCLEFVFIIFIWGYPSRDPNPSKPNILYNFLQIIEKNP